jgi:hypothetical protein
MAGIIDGLRNMFHGGANAIREAALTPQQIEDRNKGKRLLEMIKVAAVVSAIGSLFLAAIFFNAFTIVLAGVVSFTNTEVYKTADNILEILNKGAVELVARSSKANLLDQVCKNTFAMGPFLRSLHLNVDPLLLV